MAYFELAEKYFNAWISNGNVDDSYADIDNIVTWLTDKDLWTEKDKLLLSGMTAEEVYDFACDISDMVKEYILSGV